MGRPPIGKVKMTDAERQRRHRARVRQTFRDSSERVTKPGPARREAKAETAAAIGGRLAGCEVMAFDDDGVIRILEYVGRESVPDVPNSELRKDILAAWDFYQGYKRTTAKGPRTRQHKYADTVSRKADELFKLLTDPEPIARLVRGAMSQNLSGGEAEPSLVSLTYSLKKLATAALAAGRKFSGSAPMREILEVTPTEWFVGHDLAAVYEKHFSQPATRTRKDGGSPEGPFVRFATAVTAQFGEPFTDETVSKAMSAVRKPPPSSLES